MYLLIDVGGTKTRITVTEHREAFLPPVVFPTPQDAEEWVKIIHEHAKTFANGRKLHGVVVGIPGTFSKEGVVEKTPNLPKWNKYPIKMKLEGLFSCPTIIENDAALVGLGEAVFGAGKDHSIVAYITISTGVGGVRIVDGKIDRNTYGFEIGHSIIDNNQEVEALIGGGALEKKYGKPSREIHDVAMWERVTHYTGIIGANITMFWSPAIIVFGGPVMNDLHIESIEREAAQFLHMYAETPKFVRGTLNDFGGLYGGLAQSKAF